MSSIGETRLLAQLKNYNQYSIVGTLSFFPHIFTKRKVARMIQAPPKRLRSDPLSFHLHDFDERWAQSVSGVLNQGLRRDAAQQTKLRLFLASEPNQGSCFTALERCAADIHNHRPPSGNTETYLQLRLEMLACIRWLRAHGPMNHVVHIRQIASKYRCEEITALLADEPIE